MKTNKIVLCGKKFLRDYYELRTLELIKKKKFLRGKKKTISDTTCINTIDELMIYIYLCLILNQDSWVQITESQP